MGKVVPAAIFIVTAFQLLADGTSSLWPTGRSKIQQVLSPQDGLRSCAYMCKFVFWHRFASQIAKFSHIAGMAVGA